MSSTDVDTTQRQRSANRRTAAFLFAIVALFFVGFIASRFMADMATGMTVIGLAVLLFLVVAIGRNLRSGK
jgi:cell division protein FtsW (lipid II flippase)